MGDRSETSGTRFRIGPAFAGYRLDLFIQRMIPKLSRARIQRAIATRVRLTWDAPVKPSTPVREGEQVIIDDPEIQEEAVVFDPVVLHEDDDVLAIDKPPGVVVHPTHSHLRYTVITMLRRQRNEPTLTLAHRLDAETSGVLLLGRHRWAARKIQTAFERGHVGKVYRALVFGRPDRDAWEIDAPLGPYSDDDVVFRQSPKSAEAKPARTLVRVVDRFARTALVEAELVTGRRHQIRAHLALDGHPLVGDKLYGLDDRDYRRFMREGFDDDHRQALGAERTMLHSTRLNLPHPRDRERELVVHSRPPEDFRGLIERWRAEGDA